MHAGPWTSDEVDLDVERAIFTDVIGGGVDHEMSGPQTMRRRDCVETAHRSDVDIDAVEDQWCVM